MALRHRPDRIGITLDKAGWVPLGDFAAALNVDRAHVEAVVAGSDKQRFAIEFGPDGDERIRANQGHSVAVDLGLAALPPPAILYHGTSADAVDSIRATGINRGGRHHVHLSADEDTALRVGSRRRGRVVILRVDAAAMAREGHTFFRSANGVWLTDSVPAEYLSW